MATGYAGEEIGSLSATCSLNPYEGIYLTFSRVSGSGGFTNPLDSVGPCTGATNCGYNEVPAPHFQFSSGLPGDPTPGNGLTGNNYLQVQAYADNICANNIAPTAVAPRTSQCSAELRLSGNDKKNKHPGSILSYDFTTTTSYIPGTLS
jgi:hypothetical protein